MVDSDKILILRPIRATNSSQYCVDYIVFEPAAPKAHPQELLAVLYRGMIVNQINRIMPEWCHPLLGLSGRIRES